MPAALMWTVLVLTPTQVTSPVATPAPASAPQQPWAVATWKRVKARLPTPLGWAGLAGLGASGLVVASGLGVTAVAGGLVWRGRAAQDRADAVSLDGTLDTERAQLGALKQSRDAFDAARVLALVGAGTLVVGLVCSALAATVVVVDETLLVPALKSPHPLWAILGPVAGERDPAPMWPPVPRPDLPGIFTPPRAATPAASPPALAPTSKAPAPPAQDAAAPLQATPPVEPVPPPSPAASPAEAP